MKNELCHWLTSCLVIGITAILPAFAGSPPSQASHGPALRAPAVPLVTSDPYLSISSEADHLTGDVTRHWTHHPQALVSLIRIDGRPYRLMGQDPQSVPPLPQVSLRVTPTRSIYQFQNAKVHVPLTFMTAALPHDLEALSRPLSYLTWSVRSIDDQQHRVEIYDSTSSQLAINTSSEKVTWRRRHIGPLTDLRVGTVAQPVLQTSGDQIRIDWGYAHAVASTQQTSSAIGANKTLIADFIKQGSLPSKNSTRMPRTVDNHQPVLTFEFKLGEVGTAWIPAPI